MNKILALRLLSEHKSILMERFGVIRIALSGSVAINQARADSDVDILVAFDGPATADQYFNTQFYLEDIIGCPVDLVTEKALRPELKPYVKQEALYV
jgi:hypothetical protein